MTSKNTSKTHFVRQFIADGVPVTKCGRLVRSDQIVQQRKELTCRKCRQASRSI